MKIGDKIRHSGDEWIIVGLGVIREDGKQFAHLSSTTRFRHQRNGKNPVQSCDWIELA